MSPIALPRPARLALLAGSTLLLAASPARAAVTTFAQFTHSGANSIRFSDAAAGASFNAGGIPCQFDGLNLGCLPADFQDNPTVKLTLSPGTRAKGTFVPDSLDLRPVAQRDLGLSFPFVPANPSINGMTPTASGTGTFEADPLPLMVPEADARPALGLLVGVAGLWEILRRLRSGWARAGREDEITTA